MGNKKNEFTRVDRAEITKLYAAFEENDLAKAKEAITEIQAYYDRFSARMSEPKRSGISDALDKIKAAVAETDGATGKLNIDMEKLTSILNSVGARGTSEINEIKWDKRRCRGCNRSIKKYA